MHHNHQRAARFPLATNRRLVAALVVSASLGALLAGCRMEDTGLATPAPGGEDNQDSGNQPPQNPPTADAGSDLAPLFPGGVDALEPTADASADLSATPPTSVPDANDPVDAGASLPDAVAADTAPPPPPNVDPCAPTVGLLKSTALARESQSEDFVFNSEGQLLALEGGNVVQLDNKGRGEVLLRNIAYRAGRISALPDGDLLVMDASRGQLSRIDPSMRRPDRFPMYVRAPLQMTGVGSATPSQFFVSNENGQILHADADGGDVSSLTTLEDRSLGGLAVDEQRHKLYVGILDEDAVFSLTIGPRGQLSAPTSVLEDISSPTALLTDACGGLYIAGASNGAVLRRSPTGVVTTIARLDARGVVTLRLGSGKHGWSDQSLFALDGNSGTLFEIPLRP